MSFEQKYLKYKEKYLELKKQSGGVLRFPGPMIGYPAMPVPVMGPSYRVRGPVVGPSPFGPMLSPMPGPFIAGPRLIRVDSEPTCPTCATCTTCPVCPPINKINLVIKEAELKKIISSEIVGDFTFELLNTTDSIYFHEMLKKLNKSINTMI
jgi:hypothetical protein